VRAAVNRKPSKSAADFLPERKTLPVLREALQSCRGWDLYQHATQAVGGGGTALIEKLCLSGSIRAMKKIAKAVLRSP
jgi:hypothetical protein